MENYSKTPWILYLSKRVLEVLEREKEEFHKGLVNLTVDLSVNQIPIIWHRARTLKVLIIMG